ncbi:GNAT family N-acetyltransferase [Vibrio chaetopteri]|jgi:predicted N-acetyltransferase YhbS|uniref:GNAT family N-acetyltransferase n=1 Tax=Vibrio chaetopteri TaxID=3016528 RepID=A0AAU8BNZ0_9VIBR
MKIHYIEDSSVSEELNQGLITILSSCFTKPSDSRFKTQRFYNEMPQHRWYITGDHDHHVIAHLAVHEKTITAAGKAIPIAGVAEVCVHPDYRKKGLAKALIEEAHQWMEQQPFHYSILFGRDEVYTSSGYKRVTNLSLLPNEPLAQPTPVSVMVKTLNQHSWPKRTVLLPGLTF